MIQEYRLCSWFGTLIWFKCISPAQIWLKNIFIKQYTDIIMQQDKHKYKTINK